MSKRADSLSIEEARAKLFPKSRKDTFWPDQAWVPWTKPNPALILDEQIDQFVRRNVLRPKDELAAAGFHCPYYAARLAILMAVMSASTAADFEPINELRRNRLDVQEKRARKLEAQISAFNDEVKIYLWGVGPHPRTAERTDLIKLREDRKAAANAEDKLRDAADALRRIADLTAAELQRLKPFKTNLWLTTFIEQLGYSWRTLTSREPSPSSDPFKSFLAAALNTLDPNFPLIGDRPIRTACERVAARPDWDQFDRDEKDLLPPGHERKTSEQFHEDMQKRYEQWTSDMRTRCAEAEAGDPRAILELFLTYDTQPHNRAFLESLGWRQPKDPSKYLGKPKNS